MLFRDFLRVAVLLFAAAATVLAVVAIAGIQDEDTNLALYVSLGWWTIAVVAGLWLGRRNVPTDQIGRLLASARNTNAIPELAPGAIVLNRLWPLAVVTLLSGAAGLLLPQVPAIAAGYAIAVALTWRRQSSAVTAIEQRDGIRYHLDRTSPLGGPRLVRTPGLRKIEPVPEAHGAAEAGL